MGMSYLKISKSLTLGFNLKYSEVLRVGVMKLIIYKLK